MKVICLALSLIIWAKAAGAYHAEHIDRLISSYSRPITALCLSDPHVDNLTRLCQKYPASVFIAQLSHLEAVKHANNLLFLDDLTEEKLQLLSKCEHFDMAYYLGSCSYKPSMVQKLTMLADQVILHFPEDLYHLLEDFFLNLGTKILAQQDGHVLLQLTRTQPKTLQLEEIQLESSAAVVMTSFHYALLKTSKHSISLPLGLSLYGFKMLNGYHPSIDQIGDAIQAIPWKLQSACLPWNIFVQGTKIYPVERFQEPKAWSKEGLSLCLKGIKMTNFNEFREHTRQHFKIVNLEK